MQNQGRGEAVTYSGPVSLLYQRCSTVLGRTDVILAGLLGLGILPGCVLAQSTGNVLVTAEPAFDVSGAERRQLGFDHCEAGAMLADHWGFPQVLVEAIRHHHDPQ